MLDTFFPSIFKRNSNRNIFKILSLLEDLNARGVHLYAQDEDLWYGEKKMDFVQHILDATKESFYIGKRVKMSIEHRRKCGHEVFGSVEYGYKSVRDSEGRLKKVEDKNEKKVILFIKKEIVQKGKSAKEVMTELNKKGITKRGRQWTVAMVKGVIKNLLKNL